MDRSFLSDERVVAASRDFVCIRLATYEDAQEAKFLKSIFVGRSGALENTVFAILSPDAQRNLVRAGRGPFFAFRDAKEMAKEMREIAADYGPDRALSSSELQLPTMKSFALALNVAACDGLPVAVTVADETSEQARLQRKLTDVAWSESLAGQFVFATVEDRDELKNIDGIQVNGNGILVIKPDQFGLQGEVLATFAANDDPTAIAAGLSEVATGYQDQAPDHHRHVREGIRRGLEWETEVPESDPQALRARERRRGNR